MFEKKVLFPLTRVVTLLAVLGVVFVIVALSWPEKDPTDFDYAEIKESLSSSENRKDSAAIALPEELKSHLDENNTKVVENWVEKLPKGNREDFMDHLIDIMEAAENDPEVEMPKAINKYKDQVFSSIENKPDTFASAIKLVTIGGALIILLLLSNLLASLAIERNTRNS